MNSLKTNVDAFNAASAAITSLSTLYWSTGGTEGGKEIPQDALEKLHAIRSELHDKLRNEPRVFFRDSIAQLVRPPITAFLT